MGSRAQVEVLVLNRWKDTSLIGREEGAVWIQVPLEVWQEVKVSFFSDGFHFLCDVLRNKSSVGTS